jgi:biopolymer transport protein ExbD
LSEAPDKKVVNVYRNGEITLDGKDVSLEELTKSLTDARSQYKRLGVLVRGDGATSFQRVASVLSACKQAGIAELGISVHMASTETPHARR